MTVCGTLALAACQSDLGVELPALSLPRATDEEQIALVLNDVQTGMQTKRIFKVLAHVSRSYRDGEGRDYDGIRNYLSEIFRAYRTIKITRTNPRIVVEGDRARAIETFGTIAEPMETSTLPPINLQGQVSVYLERAKDTWLIVEWGPLGA
ncbi:MAG: hypothetical protein HYV26_06580 [Candidatus Hydrogenedentes bacterium]|nr:hypothetical protein [Candidatus Hydrogenedentota bacterium]